MKIRLLVLSALLGISACQRDEGPSAVVYTRDEKIVPLQVKVADPKTATAQVLLGPAPVEAGQAVVAVFPDEEKRPLSTAGARWQSDVIYLSPMRTIVDLAAGEPKQPGTPVVARAPWSAVVVTGPGFIAETKLAIGDKIDLKNVPGAN